MNKKIIKVGIVGSGRIVRWLLDDQNQWQDNTKLEAIFSTNEKTAQEYANKYNITHVCQSFDQLLALKIDLLYIGTPDHTHVQYALQALQQKINVYCEKPIAWTLKEGKRLYQLARENNALFFDGIKTGFSPAFVKAATWIKNQDIGKIILIHSTHTKVSTSGKIPHPQKDDKLFAGFNIAGGMYALFAPIYFGGPIVRAQFEKNSYLSHKATSTVAMVCRHENNVISTIVGSDHTTDNLTTVIQGTKGFITVGGNLEKYHQDYNKDSAHMAHTAQHYDLAGNKIKECDFNFTTKGEGLFFPWNHVLDLVRNDEIKSNILTPAISLNILKIIEQIENN